MRPFEIRFERVMSFQNNAMVLVGDDHGNRGIRDLLGMLCAEFAKHHFGTGTSTFVPHLTLLYDRKRLACIPVEPVCWTVKEIVLVNSEVGATKYHPLGRWEFGGES
jgi:2'-5' RNA ligase